MKQILEQSKERLTESTLLKTIDEDYGQLNFNAPSVNFPCALVSISSGTFSDIGIDRTKSPQNRQMGEINVDIRIATMKLSPGNIKATTAQKANNLRIFDVIDEIHTLIHGWTPGGNQTRFMRKSILNEKRDDGIQEYVVTYSTSLHDC